MKKASEIKAPNRWYVYILECESGTLYTGITTDVARRFAEHKAGTGAKYTRSHPVKACVYSESCDSRSTALKREAEIKRLTRPEKKALIEK